MNVRELIDYAKENGYNSVMFKCYKNDKYLYSGKFLDAYHEFVKFPVMGNGFTTLHDIEHEIGYDINFEIINNVTEYKLNVSMDYILRGKEIPKEFIESVYEND